MGICIFANTIVRATLSIGMVCMVNTTAVNAKSDGVDLSNVTNGSDIQSEPGQCDSSSLGSEDYGVSVWSHDGGKRFVQYYHVALLGS